MIKNIFYYVDGRMFEWAMSVPIIMLSLMLFIWPIMAINPAFALFASVFPKNMIAVTLLICGVACVAALIVNGRSKEIGPRVRSWAALARAVLWFQFGLSTIQASMAQGFPYTIIPFWFTFALAELWVAYRAVLDVRSSH